MNAAEPMRDKKGAEGALDDDCETGAFGRSWLISPLLGLTYTGLPRLEKGCQPGGSGGALGAPLEGGGGEGAICCC
jgi:hypothetical protein